MPLLSRVFIRLGLLHLLAALLLAGWMVVTPSSGVWRPVFYHLFIVGWIFQLIIGVAYWMFPKLNKATPRGDTAAMWSVLVFLNLGLWLRVIGEPLGVLNAEALGIASLLMVVSAILQWLAGVGFVYAIWGRVKER